MDVVVVPSRKESLPLVALEAMALSRPVIASRTGDLPDVIRDGRSGLLVPAEDVAALAAAMRQLAGSQHMRQQLGADARQRIVESYSIPAMAKSLAEIYQDLVRRRGQ